MSPQRKRCLLLAHLSQIGSLSAVKKTINATSILFPPESRYRLACFRVQFSTQACALRAVMVCAIKNFTYRGDICNLKDRSAAEPQPKNGRRKGKFNHEAREVRKI